MRSAYEKMDDLSSRLQALDRNDRESDFTADDMLKAVNKVFSLTKDSGFYGAWLDEAKVVFAFDEREMSARSIGVLISKRLDEIGIKNSVETSKPYLPEGRHDSIKYVNVIIKRR